MHATALVPVTTPERQRPGMTAAAEAERQARIAREAEALRTNLRRRKEQARARDTASVKTETKD